MTAAHLVSCAFLLSFLFCVASLFPFVTQAHLSKPITVCIRGAPVRIRAGTAMNSHTGSPSTHNEIVPIRGLTIYLAHSLSYPLPC